MDEAQVLNLARRHGLLPDTAVRHASLGIDNEVWFLGQESVLRTPCDQEHSRYMEGEIGIWEFVEEGGLRVPELVASGVREEGLPYMIIRRVEGQLLGETDRGADLSCLVEEIAGQLLVLHSLRGANREEWKRPFDDFDPWPYFRKAWDAEALPRRDLLEIEAFIQRLGELPGNYRSGEVYRRGEPIGGEVLTHNDLHAWNLMVVGDPPRLSSIIDWGDSCVSDRRNDLSTLPLDLQVRIADTYRTGTAVGPGFTARILWAWLDISLWEIMNLESMGYARGWWRWPPGGWAEVKRILKAAGRDWIV